MITVNTKLSKDPCYCLPAIGTFASSVPNTLAAILLQEAREGKVCSCIITNSLGKTQSFHTQTKLAAFDCTEPNWVSLPTHAFGRYSLSTPLRFSQKEYSSGAFQTCRCETHVIFHPRPPKIQVHFHKAMLLYMTTETTLKVRVRAICITRKTLWHTVDFQKKCDKCSAGLDETKKIEKKKAVTAEKGQGKCRSIDDKGVKKKWKEKKTWGKFPFWRKKKNTHFLPHFGSTSESINGTEEPRTF